MAFNMRPTKNQMPSQEPNVRNKNFLEVATGYTEEMAIDEAKRCLNCKNKPCVAHCPVNINIPEFISQVAIGEFEKAYELAPEDPWICFEYGNFFFLEGNYQKALELYNKAIQINPLQTEYFIAKAVLMNKIQKFAKTR